MRKTVDVYSCGLWRCWDYFWKDLRCPGEIVLSMRTLSLYLSFQPWEQIQDCVSSCLTVQLHAAGVCPPFSSTFYYSFFSSFFFFHSFFFSFLFTYLLSIFNLPTGLFPFFSTEVFFSSKDSQLIVHMTCERRTPFRYEGDLYIGTIVTSHLYKLWRA